MVMEDYLFIFHPILSYYKLVLSQRICSSYTVWSVKNLDNHAYPPSTCFFINKSYFVIKKISSDLQDKSTYGTQGSLVAQEILTRC